ncbi:uroporphyrinogen-III synthase [Rickettsia endosymbiont of Orchestes rusci]|uniref:uroporphyrinogen-III synthase n=1 Tax=Rickettsia endosymbiont of Orchestes rusci TaxID=3066250 RepID=UPI00313AD168
MKYVLLTRSIEGNKETIEEIAKHNINNLGFHYIHCPLIEYKNLNLSPEILGNYSNIIITSKYAANILREWQNNNYNIWVVGEASKAILERSGFIVKYAAKNVDDLIKHFPSRLYNQTIYLSSNEITRDLPSQIKRQIIYNVKYLEQLPPIELFKSNIDYILLYSQNSAKIFKKLLLQNHLSEVLQNSLVIAISLKVANIIRPFSKNVVYCNNENSHTIINLLMHDAKIRNQS